MLNTCPPEAEEIADAYPIGHLSEDEIEAYEQHYLGCAKCFERLLQTLEFIRSVRGAARLRAGVAASGLSTTTENVKYNSRTMWKCFLVLLAVVPACANTLTFSVSTTQPTLDNYAGGEVFDYMAIETFDVTVAPNPNPPPLGFDAEIVFTYSWTVAPPTCSYTGPPSDFICMWGFNNGLESFGVPSSFAVGDGVSSAGGDLSANGAQVGTDYLIAGTYKFSLYASAY